MIVHRGPGVGAIIEDLGVPNTATFHGVDSNSMGGRSEIDSDVSIDTSVWCVLGPPRSMCAFLAFPQAFRVAFPQRPCLRPRASGCWPLDFSGSNFESGLGKPFRVDCNSNRHRLIWSMSVNIQASSAQFGRPWPILVRVRSFGTNLAYSARRLPHVCESD